MTSGISGSNKRDRKDTTGNAKLMSKEVAAQPASMENLMAQFLSLEGKQLRAVFDRAISDHNKRVEAANQQYVDNVQDIDASIDLLQQEIEHHTKAIADAENKKQDFYVHKKEEQQEHNDRLDKLDEGRTLIENMMQLFRHKLDGFNE